MRKYWVIILISVIVISCDEVDTTQLSYDYDYNYFPVDSGDWREYEVLQIIIDKATDVYDTSEYYLREQVGSVFIDGANDTMQILNRYYKDSIHKEWELFSVWYMGVAFNEAVQVEGNIKYIKQKYPLLLDKSWNGNAYNRTDTLNELSYNVTQIDVPEVISTIAFDSVLTITQRDFLSLVEKYSFYEKYAKGIGLIYKEQVDIYAGDQVDPSIPIEQRVTTGEMYYQKIYDYGKAN